MQKKNGSLSYILLDTSEWVSRRWIMPAELYCLFFVQEQNSAPLKIQTNLRKAPSLYRNTATYLLSMLRSGSKETIISRRKYMQTADRTSKLLHCIFICKYSFLAGRCWPSVLRTWTECLSFSVTQCSVPLLVSARTCVQHTAEYPFFFLLLKHNWLAVSIRFNNPRSATLQIPF